MVSCYSNVASATLSNKSCTSHSEDGHEDDLEPLQRTIIATTSAILLLLFISQFPRLRRLVVLRGKRL